MSDATLENNEFYSFLKNALHDHLSKWIEPYWLICVPENSSLKNLEHKFSFPFAAAQALLAQDERRCQYTSELCGSSIIYEINGSDLRVIKWQDNEDIMCKAFIKNEYLVSLKEHVLHVLLIDRPLPSMIEDDHSILPQIMSVSVTSNKQAEEFLRRFHCHFPVLQWIKDEVQRIKTDVIPSGDVDHIQCHLHGLILQAWDALIKRHLPELQTNTHFQDLLYRALDFYVVGMCHSKLWTQVLTRCHTVDLMVKTRLSFLRSTDISPSQFGMPSDYCTPLPAALVEMASISGRSSPIEMLHCVRDSIEFIEAQTKEAKALLYQFKDADTDLNEWLLTEEELVTLMVVVVVQARCFNLVANIYYMTHYVFSVPDELHPLWHSLGILRQCLEQIMKLDIASLPPVKHPMRRELSLQDLMKVSAEVESRFESRHNREGSRSTSDITSLDLLLKHLTQQIRLSTQAHSETHVDERDSPSRRVEPSLVPFIPSQNMGAQSKMQTFVEFVSTIPSTIRASFRRRQSEQRSAIHSIYSSNGS